MLRKLLLDRGITQKQLAIDMNIPSSTLGNYIQDSREPDFKTLKQLADYFDVSVDYLIGHPSKKANTDMEDDLLGVFRALPENQQVLYLEQGKVMVRLNNQNKAK